jgi:hypothetical protein
MHQMRISTTYVSSVMHREKFGNPKGYDCKDPNKNPKK